MLVKRLRIGSRLTVWPEELHEFASLTPTDLFGPTSFDSLNGPMGNMFFVYKLYALVNSVILFVSSKSAKRSPRISAQKSDSGQTLRISGAGV